MCLSKIKNKMTKRKLLPTTTRQHLAEIIRLLNGELTTAAMLYWQRLSVDELPLWEVENLKQYLKQAELKLQQARLICEMLEKTAMLKENQN
jgi:hypothetical protein